MSLLDFEYFRAVLKQNGYELVKKQDGTSYIRRRPFTREVPTPAMERARAAMTLASQSQTGTRGFSQTGIPNVAEGNRRRIREVLLFYKVTTEDQRVWRAKEVAAELGLNEDEKERLIALVKK